MHRKKNGEIKRKNSTDNLKRNKSGWIEYETDVNVKSVRETWVDFIRQLQSCRLIEKKSRAKMKPRTFYIFSSINSTVDSFNPNYSDAKGCVHAGLWLL